tara:strand:+ start:133 stop:372 length:240 start_codon:yes stop_codon:yes gene_type:complete
MNETYGCHVCGDVLTNGSQTVVVCGGVANAKVEVCKKCLDEHHQHFFLVTEAQADAQSAVSEEVQLWRSNLSREMEQES